MKKFATIVILSLIMTGCITPAEAKTPPNTIYFGNTVDFQRTTPLIDNMVQHRNFTIRSISLSKNTEDLSLAVANTTKQVGKTWYVFAGSSPRGWDCSGLVRWTYAHLDINLYHGANSQMNSGKTVSEPKYGDLVGFKYRSSSRYYHVGIYVSEDLMLHSGGKRGDKTELRSISGWAKDNHNSIISYTRIVETN